MTTLRTAAQQALEALERQHKDRTAYSRAKQSANATCGEFKENTLSALIESGYMQVMGNQTVEAITALRTALAQEQAEPVSGIIESDIKGDSHQTLDDAMQQPRAMAQAYENGYKAGAAAERKRIIQFLTEMQRQVGDGHNHYGVAAMRIRERV